jgi:hypothetical protein
VLSERARERAPPSIERLRYASTRRTRNMVELILWPEENWAENRDEFVVDGCRVTLAGARVRVEPLHTGANAQAIADEYVAALREHVGGVTRVLTIQELGALPPRSITIHTSDRRARATRRMQVGRARRDVVVRRRPRLSQCYDYFESAVDDSAHALSHLYKLVESVEEELGGERQAKERLDAATEVNVIKRLANDRSVLSRDQRHAPKTPGTGTRLTLEERSQVLQAGNSILRKFEMMV